MCGIAGVLDARQAPTPDQVHAQLELLLHRGPDAKAVYGAGPALIGQTRLSVIDLETGDPPITNEDGSVFVALNGEIYNYQALRHDLLGRGHVFATVGDTEILAHGAEDMEPIELARSLHGMFAAAVWDTRRKRLLLLRDRLGKKPLYYWTDGTHISFASEIKALFKDPRVPRRLNRSVLASYLTFGYVPTPDTFFEGVRSLPPGHVLVFEADGAMALLEYWRPPLPGVDGTTLEVSFEDSARRVRTLVTDAVERRLISDVPLGAFLSGGIDSSAVVALMSQLTDRPVKTFTIGFEDDAAFDERPYARIVADRYRTDHTEFVVRPDAISLIDELVWHYDQPFGDASSIPTYLLSKLTRDHVTVALSGDGGDELFAGYERFGAALVLDRYERVPPTLRRVIATGAASVPSSTGGRLRAVQRFLSTKTRLPDAFVDWQSYVPREIRQALLPGAVNGDWQGYLGLWRETEGAHLLDRLVNFNVRSYLVDDLLPKADRMSMAHGLEVRSPFLDHELAEFVLRLPPSSRVRGMNLKRVLKAAVDDLLPPEIVDRRKKGFGVPLDRWFRSDLAPYAGSMLQSASSRVRDHLDPGVVDGLMETHRAGRADHGETIWTLLTLESFLRKEGW
jgi:asparagine synthase (glutamine-hydrolysing)